MNVDNKLLKDIKENNLTLETAFLLYSKKDKTEQIDYNFSPLTYLLLRKKGLLSAENLLTEEGIRICNLLFDSTDAVNSEYIKDFDKFWEAYPTDDAWGGYYPTRRIKNSKVRARISYLALRKEYSSSEILKALENHITMMKNTSIGQNNLKYMQNPATWLSNRTFESFLDEKLKKKQDIYSDYGKEVN